MADVVACTCGARIRLPETRSGQSLRCPRCKAVLVVARDERIVASALVDPAEQAGTCPICQSAIGHADAVIVCPLCDQVHHNECWTEVGGCATYGCQNAPTSEKNALDGFNHFGLGRYQEMPGLWGDHQVDRAQVPVLWHRI